MKIAVIGVGKLCSAMVPRWLDDEAVKSVAAVNPTKLREKYSDQDFPYDLKLTEFSSVQHFAENMPDAPDIIVLGIKHKYLADVAATLKPICEKSIIVSVMAGVSVDTLQELFGKDAAIVRTMPNIAALAGRSTTLLAAGTNVNEEQKSAVKKLMDCCGSSFWIDDENLIDVITPVTGSGPALYMRMVEAAVKALHKLGVPAEMAQQMARDAFEGAAALSELRAESSPEDIRIQVTSPGGSTAEMISSLDDQDSLNIVVKKAVEAAAVKNRELGEDL